MEGTAPAVPSVIPFPCGTTMAEATFPASAPDPAAEAPQAVFDYHRTIVGYHGTTKAAAKRLVDGKPFGPSTNDDDWLGHGIYFWEYAPQQAWWWAKRRYSGNAAVIGAMIRLGRCFDLLDPANTSVLKEAHKGLASDMKVAQQPMPKNANTHKYLDCAIFQHLFSELDDVGFTYETCRAVFVPMSGGKMPRLWDRSGIFSGGHIQVTVRAPENILAVWRVREDGRYGKD
jgi:hypothetical protein